MEEYGVLGEYGLKGKKSLGQNFLVDAAAISRIVEAADLSAEDTVLEVGPGPGALTVQLAQQAGRVIAVEVDERMLAPLAQALEPYDNVRVVCGDILEQDVAALAETRRYKVVANLPYYITSAVLRHVLEASLRPDLVVVTVQREVAERVIGRPRGHRSASRMSLLAVSVQFYGVPRIVARIPAGAFRPVPAVSSAVVRIEVYDPLPWGAVDRRAFFRVVRAGFAQPRKQIHNSLAHNLGLPAARVASALNGAGIDGRRRAETLSVEEWVTLSHTLEG